MSRAEGADGVLNKGEKSSQRRRLLNAMTETCARRGYSQSTVADAVARAGVSRASFYEYFADKEHCFTAALEHYHAQFLSQVQDGVSHHAGGEISHAAIRALLGFARRDPDAMQLLIHEALAGGEDSAHIYDQLLEDTTKIIEQAEREHGAEQRLILPLRTLLGGVCQGLWPPLHNGETSVHRLIDDIDRWIDSYRCAPGVQAPEPCLPDLPQEPRFLPDPPLRAPAPLRPGRRSLPTGDVNSNRRERILHATASVAASQGYLAMTVDHIVAEAQIARRVFYEHFSDKDDAYVAATEFFGQPLLATAAKAFFGLGSWPERIWRASLAVLEFMSTYPAVAHLMVVESFAASEAVKRSVHATGRALMLLLEEGYHLDVTEETPPRASELIAATVGHLLNQHLRLHDGHELPLWLPSYASIILTPFMGTDAAASFIAEQAERS